MSKWKTIMNNLTDGVETCIVGWETEEQEDGVTIAVIIHETKKIEYKDEDARTDDYAQEKINKILDKLWSK